MEGDGASCCKVSRTARKKSAQQCASLSSFGRKANERTSHVCAGLRRWQPQAVTSSPSRSLGSISGNYCCWQSFPGHGSKGKGSACVKPESFLHHVKPWCQDAQSWTKILFCQQVPETGFLLSTSKRQSRSRLIIMVSTYQGTLNKRTYHVFFSFLIYVHTEGLL